jgi:hypothetical protein
VKPAAAAAGAPAAAGATYTDTPNTQVRPQHNVRGGVVEPWWYIVFSRGHSVKRLHRPCMHLCTSCSETCLCDMQPLQVRQFIAKRLFISSRPPPPACPAYVPNLTASAAALLQMCQTIAKHSFTTADHHHLHVPLMCLTSPHLLLFFCRCARSSRSACWSPS